MTKQYPLSYEEMMKRQYKNVEDQKLSYKEFSTLYNKGKCPCNGCVERREQKRNDVLSTNTETI